MQFRNWIPGLAKARFSKVRFDRYMDELEGGRFRVIVGEFAKSGNFKTLFKNFTRLSTEILLSMPVLSRYTAQFSQYDKAQNQKALEFFYNKFIAENPELANKVSIEDFQEFRAAKLKGMAKEFALTLSMLALVGLMKGLIPDDKEDKLTKILAKTAYKASNRGLLELTFWLDPRSVMQIIDAPFPSSRVFVDMAKWIANTIDVFRDTIFMDDSTDTFWQKKGGSAVLKKSQRDRTPALYYTSQKVPMLSAIIDFLDFFDKPIPQ